MKTKKNLKMHNGMVDFKQLYPITIEGSKSLLLEWSEYVVENVGDRHEARKMLDAQHEAKQYLLLESDYCVTSDEYQLVHGTLNACHEILVSQIHLHKTLNEEW